MPRRAREKETPYEPPYVATVQSMMGHLVRTGRMTFLAWQVLGLVFERCEWGNKIPLHQADMARELRKDPADINRAVQRLLDIKVLVRSKKEGEHPQYVLNPYVGVKGKNGIERQALRREYGRDLCEEEGEGDG